MSSKPNGRFFIRKKSTSSAFSTAPEETPGKRKQEHVLKKSTARFRNINRVQFSFIVLFVLFIAASGIATYAYHLYQQSEQKVKTLQNSNSKETSKLEAQKIIAAVGKLIVLPKDETPTIATVTDSTKLKNQPFFAKASNGDKILIYSKAKKAILFNPTQNVVVEVAPVNLGKNQEVAGTTASAPTQIPTPTTVVQVQPIVTYPPLEATIQP